MLGILSLVAWCLPICGGPVSIVGLIFGARGLNATNRWMSIVGIALCSIGLLLTIVNAAIGAYLGATGQHPLFPRNNP
ncbi:MAG: hypothetical protein NZ843_06260 [Fimbriimonadales bacterium]|nr:hypothetical protein [Fimbriimonadales bacterium]